MVHKTKKNSRLSSFSFWKPCYQNQISKYIVVNKGSHSYFETSLAPQSKTFPAMIPSMRAICRCSHGRASNSLSLLESRRSAASFSSCFTCKLKERRIKRVTSQKKGGKQALVQIGRKIYRFWSKWQGKRAPHKRWKTCVVKKAGKQTSADAGKSGKRVLVHWESYYRVSKVNRNCIGFAFFRSVIGPENSRHSLNQSNAKLKPIKTWSPAFSRALGSLLDSTLSSHWFLGVFSFHVIGRYDNFALVLRHST